MKIHADLHAHSVYAGGARAGGSSSRQIIEKLHRRFIETSIYSPLKGINMIGTGDIQFDPWLDFIKLNLHETQTGIFEYNKEKQHLHNAFLPTSVEYKTPSYVLQTELIFTGPVKNSKKRKRVHVLILFPDFISVEKLNELMDQWGVARKNMARPFVVCETREEISNKINQIYDIHPLVELIPAHILTPEGIYGGNLRINYLEDFFGDSHENIHAIETGLSADPKILALIPELDDLTLLSNADAHSSKLNRIGREFTTFKLSKLNYKALIESIRNKKVIQTAEFHPTEGRYFLTGHRGGRTRPGRHNKNQFCCYSPKFVPENDMCSQCGKELTIGVLQRAFEICKIQGADRALGGFKQKFVTMVPLIEIIAKSYNIKSLTAKKVVITYRDVLEIVQTEVNLWTGENVLKNITSSNLNDNLVKNIIAIKKGNFSFIPGGFDGVYGELQIGQKLNFEEISIVKNL